MIEANTKCTYCDSDFQWNYELDVNEHWMNSALKIVVVCVQQTNVHAAIHWEKWMRASQEHRKKLILNRMCTSNARHNHTEIITQWWEREKKHRSIKNDKFISYPLLNSNLIFFFASTQYLCLFVFAKQTQTGGAGGNEKECIHIVQSVQKSLAFVDEIRVEKIFVFVWQVAKCTESEREWVSSRRKKHHHWQEILNLSVANRICQETGTFFPLSRHHVRCFYLFPNVMRRDSLLKHINQFFLFTTTTFFHPRATRIKYIFMTFFGRDMHSTSIHSDVALFPPPSNVVFNHGFSSMEYSVHGEKIDSWALTRDLIASTLPICRCTAHRLAESSASKSIR